MNSTLKPTADFDALTDAQRDQLHLWLDDGIATRTLMTKLKDEFGFVITYNKLYRYGQRLLQARLLSEHRQNKITVATFHDLLNGNLVPYDEAGLALIQKRAFEAACSPKLRISQLATLQRVFHYKTARAEGARRAAQADRRIDLADRSLQLRQEIHAFLKEQVQRRAEPKPKLPPPVQEDHLGPLARTWEDVNRRARRAFGITDEEHARRQAIRAKRSGELKLPRDDGSYFQTNHESNGDATLTSALPVEQASEAAPEGNSNVASCPDETTAPQTENSTLNSDFVSSSETQNSKHVREAHETQPVLACTQNSSTSSPTLAEQVDAYTVDRVREYIAHNQNHTPWPHRHPAPEFITENRHCPCGHACPCPTHETIPDVGPFPPIFWKLTPFHSDYALCLQERNLPFRRPTEYLA